MKESCSSSFFVAMAESEGPSVTPPRKKPKRQQSHFDASWIIGKSNESQ